MLKSSKLFYIIHIFKRSDEVVDEIGSTPRLVVFEPEESNAFSKLNLQAFTEKFVRFSRQCGKETRIYKNRLIFLVADQTSLAKLYDHTKTFLALRIMEENFNKGITTYDDQRLAVLKKTLESSKNTFLKTIQETYKWLVNPIEFPAQGKLDRKWKFSSLLTNSQNISLISAIEGLIKNEDWIIYNLSPARLHSILEEWYFLNGQIDVGTEEVLNDMLSKTHLPRILNESVLKKAILDGIMTEDFFGYAQSIDNGNYFGMVIGNIGTVKIDEKTRLVKKEIALAVRKN